MEINFRSSFVFFFNIDKKMILEKILDLFLFNLEKQWFWEKITNMFLFNIEK